MAKAALSAAVSAPRTIRDKAFARRLNDACDSNPQVPAYNFGRLAWVRTNLEKRHRIKVSTETVRKWFAGEARPRPDKLKTLSALLGVDEAWLSLGITPEMTPRDRKTFNARADGAVNLAAGFIQLNGGHPAFPAEGDERMKNTNLTAIIQGVVHAFYVTLGQRIEGGCYRFVFPADHSQTIVLGVVPTGSLKCDFIRFDAEQMDTHAAYKGGHAEVFVQKTASGYQTEESRWEKLKTFERSLI